ncbi:MAG: hypothetical protein K8T89_08775, partial [Planctomycetes bacterium]|nr:hypothetical protein [Planctomycetota bacterium]
MQGYLHFELIEPCRQIEVGEKFTLRLAVTCPSERQYPMAIVSIHSDPANRIDVDTSMLPRELVLRPAEVCTLAVDVTFRDAGMTDTNRIDVEMKPIGGPDYLGKILPLPAHPIRVVPSLAKELDFKVERICQYGSAVKVEIDLKYNGTHDLTDVEWTFGPSQQVRSGVTRRRLPLIKEGNRFADEMVIVGDRIEIDLSATCQKERIRIQKKESIPTMAEIE